MNVLLFAQLGNLSVLLASDKLHPDLKSIVESVAHTAVVNAECYYQPEETETLQLVSKAA